jgi:hypothetical protein
MKSVLGLVERERLDRIDRARVDGARLCIAVHRRRPQFMGLVWRGEGLFLDTRSFASFRSRLENLEDLQRSLQLYSKREPVDLDYLDGYFGRSCDSPFALQHVLRSIREGVALNDLTEFPALSCPKSAAEHRAAVLALHELAQPGDTLFTFDRSSRVAGLIRRYDRSPWSHVALVTDSKTIVDSTPGGVVENTFESLAELPDFDVALYRYRGINADEAAAAATAAQSMIGIRGYGWHRVLRFFLRNQFGIPYPGEHSVADIAYSNKLTLIGHA